MGKLSDYTSLRVGGPAQEIVSASNEAEIISAVQVADAAGKRVLILGSGTNLLVSDAGFDGVVIDVSSAKVEIEVAACSGATLTIGAREVWDSLVETTISRGYAGLETLSGITGTIGAAPSPI